MKATLRASSVLRHFLLFDPSAIEHVFHHGRRPGLEEWTRETRNGNAACYAGLIKSDTGTIVRVYVDEAPEPQICERRERPVFGHLYVPDGELFLIGVEDLLHLARRGEIGRDNDLVEMVEKMRLPPGDYAVEAFHLNWNDPPVPKPLLTADRVSEGLRWAVFVLLLGVPMLVLLKSARRAWAHVVVGLLLAAMALLFLWEGVRRASPVGWLRGFLARAEDRFPHAVVVLTRLPPGTRTATLNGCTFGPGAFPAPGFEVIIAR